ncbi:MAG TPA: biotin/lipoyl-containing protein, partial [Microbacteriaceae bacterium]|nr:biotin/lipoyl-containing protein [Microbacteriaceae bacterium]
MAGVIRMPSVLAGAEEGAIAAWLVAEGDEVAVGDTIAEVETDKATVEYQAEEAGVVGRILVPVGAVVPVGDPIVVLVGAGEDAAAVERELGLSAAASPEQDSAGTSGADGVGPAGRGVGAAPAAGRAGRTRIFASPVARKLAREQGIDVGSVEGTGPDGRITRRDVEKVLRTVRQV